MMLELFLLPSCGVLPAVALAFCTSAPKRVFQGANGKGTGLGPSWVPRLRPQLGLGQAHGVANVPVLPKSLLQGYGVGQHQPPSPGAQNGPSDVLICLLGLNYCLIGLACRAPSSCAQTPPRRLRPRRQTMVFWGGPATLAPRNLGFPKPSAPLRAQNPLQGFLGSPVGCVLGAVAVPGLGTRCRKGLSWSKCHCCPLAPGRRGLERLRGCLPCGYGVGKGKQNPLSANNSGEAERAGTAGMRSSSSSGWICALGFLHLCGVYLPLKPTAPAVGSLGWGTPKPPRMWLSQ